jgi:hypothetical protein
MPGACACAPSAIDSAAIAEKTVVLRKNDPIISPGFDVTRNCGAAGSRALHGALGAEAIE